MDGQSDLIIEDVQELVSCLFSLP